MANRKFSCRYAWNPIPEFRIFHVASTGSLTLEGVIVANGLSSSGGGIRNLGVLGLVSSIVRDNTSSLEGGGIMNFGTANLFESEVSGNDTGVGVGGANGFGGGISNFGPFARLTLTRSTVRDNTAAINGGGIENSGVMLSLSDSTVNLNTAGFGGGILNDPRGSGANSTTATLTGSTVSRNTSSNGGGIENFPNATLTLRNSTVSGNIGGVGGGIINAGTLTLNNVTITANQLSQNAPPEGVQGIINVGTATVSNTIIAQNPDVTGQQVDDRDCSGAFTSLGFNLIGNNQGTLCSGFGAAGTEGDHVGTPAQPINPGLGPLSRNIGPDNLPGVTETHLLFVGSSPAVDAGNPATPRSMDNACERMDQRGFDRPQDGDQMPPAICDIGAVEIRPGGG